MRPNIIFLLVDGFRADQCFGKDKTSVTPNIDSLIQKGMYFTNAYSSVDGTILSLRTIFHSLNPIKIGNRNKLTLQKNNLFEIFEKNGYEINGLIPDLKGFSEYANCFQNLNKTYTYWDYMGKMDKFLSNTSSAITDKVIDFLKSKESNSPWFYYVHLMTLHPLKEYFANHKNEQNSLNLGIGNFDSEEYGKGLYERTVSFIDYQLGKILENVNLNNTILILTADHGQSIPYQGNSEVDFQPKLENTVTIGKKLLPKSAHKIGGKFLHNIRKSVGKSKLEKSNKTLTNYEKRSRDPYFTLSLYDELIHVPLLFVGSSINPQIIKKQARHVDICSTIYDLLGITVINEKSGESLRSNEYDIEKNIQYLHTMPYQKLSTSDMVGIRNNEYKYFRFARNLNENVHLYDLKQDPYENNNIADENKELILEFEKKIIEFEENDLSNDDDDLSEEELTKISGQLKKLGYM